VVARKGWEALFIRITFDAGNSRKQKLLIYVGTVNLQPNQNFIPGTFNSFRPLTSKSTGVKTTRIKVDDNSAKKSFSEKKKKKKNQH